MKRSIILFLILTLHVFSQSSILNETFSDFTFDSTDADLVWHYRFIGDAEAVNDLSGNGLTLTKVNSIGDSITANKSIILAGGAVVYGNGTSQYYSINNANAIKANNFSTVVKYNLEAAAADEYLYAYRFGRHRVLSTATLTSYVYYNGTGFVGGNTADVKVDSTWHIAVFTKTSTGGTGGKLYLDNVLKVNRAEDTTAIVPFDNVLTFYGNLNSGTSASNWSKGWINEAFMLNRILSTKEIAEITYLAAEWNSKNGGLFRSNWAFNQGFATDTISHVITVAGAAVGYIDAWGAAGGETLSVYNAAGDAQTFVLTTDSTRYTISSITFAENDSLFVGSAGTVTVDNVYLETAPDVSPNIYSNNFTGFPEFPDFINDEVIQ